MSVPSFLGALDCQPYRCPAIRLIVNAEDPPATQQENVALEGPMMVLPDLQPKRCPALCLSAVFIEKDHFSSQFPVVSGQF